MREREKKDADVQIALVKEKEKDKIEDKEKEKKNFCCSTQQLKTSYEHERATLRLHSLQQFMVSLVYLPCAPRAPNRMTSSIFRGLGGLGCCSLPAPRNERCWRH